MFATILGSIGNIIEEINRKSNDYRKDKEVLNKFFSSKEGTYLSYDIKAMLTSYLKYLYIGH